MILCKNNVPDVYTKSEDYLCVLRLLDLVANTEYQKNKINKVLDPMMCPYELLPSLAKRMGYKYDNSIPIIDNRIIMSAFPTMMKNKGNKIGIELAVKTAIKLSDHIKNINGVSSYTVDYKSSPSRVITINLYCIQCSRKINDLLNYVRPVGYKIIITPFSPPVSIEASNSIKVRSIDNWGPKWYLENAYGTGLQGNPYEDVIITDMINDPNVIPVVVPAFKIRFLLIPDKIGATEAATVKDIQVHARLTYRKTVRIEPTIETTTIETADICIKEDGTIDEMYGGSWGLLIDDTYNKIWDIGTPETITAGCQYQKGVAILNKKTISNTEYELVSVDNMYIQITVNDIVITKTVNQLGLI